MILPRVDQTMNSGIHINVCVGSSKQPLNIMKCVLTTMCHISTNAVPCVSVGEIRVLWKEELVPGSGV